MLSRIRGEITEEARGTERDLWDVIVNNDDVCFEHILPRLNQTDIKFLHDVNTETRALIKRSSRKDELRKAFKVSEISSISTLRGRIDRCGQFEWINVNAKSSYVFRWCEIETREEKKRNAKQKERDTCDMNRQKNEQNWNTERHIHILNNHCVY